MGQGADQAWLRRPGHLVCLLSSVIPSQSMPDNPQHGITPKLVVIAATDRHESQISLIDRHFDALSAKQHAQNVLHNDPHPTAVSLTRSSPPRRTSPCVAGTSRRRVRHRERQAITNDLLRSAITDLEDELIHHTKKQHRVGNGAVKSASEVLAEQRSYAYDQPPSILKGNMIVSLVDLVVNRRKGKLKCEVIGLIYSVSVPLIYRVSSSIRRLRSRFSAQG